LNPPIYKKTYAMQRLQLPRKVALQAL